MINENKFSVINDYLLWIKEIFKCELRIITKSQKTLLCQKPRVFEHVGNPVISEHYQKVMLSEAIRIPSGILRFNAEMNGGFS